MPLTAGPCPYHDPKKPDCGKRTQCPVRIYDRKAVCTELNPLQILLVRSWIEGEVIPLEEVEP